MTDNKVVISNNCAFQGSGNPASYIMLMSEKNSLNEEIMTLDNNSTGVIYYADSGMIKVSNNATAKQLTGHRIILDNNATISYDSALSNVNFSGGPAGGVSPLIGLALLLRRLVGRTSGASGRAQWNRTRESWRSTPVISPIEA